jgi:hypothetical protein
MAADLPAIPEVAELGPLERQARGSIRPARRGKVSAAVGALSRRGLL